MSDNGTKTCPYDVPSGYQFFESQVAGHSILENNIGMLRDSSGCVLKPISNTEHSKSEIVFYEKVFITKEWDEFKPFVPNYQGTVTLPIHNKDTVFIRIEDLTRNLSKPCVMDIKIGAQTWEPSAPLKKQESEWKKYQDCKRNYGLCLPGFQYYDWKSGECIRKGKEFGKQLKKDSLPDALRLFFNVDSGKSGIIIRECIRRLKHLLNWWTEQRKVHIYASSILLLYDYEKFSQLSSSDISIDITSWVKTSMIDFSHVVPANSLMDNNYVFGLKNLILLLESL